MADGSPENRGGPKQLKDLTFFATDQGLGDTKKCSGGTSDGDSVKLSFYKEQIASESCEKSDTRGVADESATVAVADFRNSSDVNVTSEDRKKRCIDRYDSSESSDSGVAVLSPTESGGCSGSDITEPRSPRSPESACSITEEGASTRMPPWVNDPAPPAPRRLAVQPAPVRRPNPPNHRRITEFFNHKMKPQNGLKRDCNSVANEDSKKKCLPKNGVTHDLEKYISYLSQTLSPKVLLDVGKQTDGIRKPVYPSSNTVPEGSTGTDLGKSYSNPNVPNSIDFGRSKETGEKIHTTMNGFVEVRRGSEMFSKEKQPSGAFNGLMNGKRQKLDTKVTQNSSTNGIVTIQKLETDITKRKIPIPASNDIVGMRIGSGTTISPSPKKSHSVKPESIKTNGVVSSTTTLDIRMNGVTCGSNNLSLSPITSKPAVAKKEPWKKVQPVKRTNRKSSACIANSKNLTWSKANNLKQVQLQKQNCVSLNQNQSLKNNTNNMNAAPKPAIPNGMRQVSMTVNGNISTLNMPVTNLQNCHQINIPQPCNGTVTSNNLASFVAVPQNVMLTTLRIPHNGLQAPTLGHQNNMPAFNRPNVNVSSPTKLSGQFVFPLMQNINGTVVQIPNLMAKMPNFVLPSTPQLTTQRQQDHIPNQHAAQILINGTLLKLANAVSSTYPNVNKPGPVTSQSIPVMNKNVSGIQAVGMTVQPKPNFAVNLSHPLLVPQPGFIVTSVPNINVKETWSYTSSSTVSSSQSVCSNPIVNHPSSSYDRVTNFTTHALHTSNIPIAPVKPPDNPIQGTDPPSSTVKEPDSSESNKFSCDIPWLSKTVNNNIVPLETIKMSARPFVSVNNVSEKLKDFAAQKTNIGVDEHFKRKISKDNIEDLRKVEEVARREETIFTQITVLKDISSNVHSTVIESNFCSTTTESESGIGTDKSIDSPSDSQTSKECDEDSSLSLSVSLCSVDVQCQKSPILKQPKTLRFPPKSSVKSNNDRRKTSTDTTTTVIVCFWENCKKEFESDPELLDHLQAAHVETQVGKENYVCLWERCKVRGKPSCSRLWLERHTLSHGSNKPFKCIVDGCERRFSTQTLLERHVNNHFNESTPNGSGSRKTSESGSKLIRRNGKKLRYRRQPWSARMFDFFDAGTMEGLAWRLLRCTRWRLGGACPLREPPGRHTLTLHTALTATRYNAVDRRTEALVTYYPPHVLEDEWVPVKDVKRIKRVEIVQLPVSTKVMLYEQFCDSYRKPTSTQPVKRLLNSPSVPNDPLRTLPPRNCTSSRLLNNLLAKQKRMSETKSSTTTTAAASISSYSMVYREDEKTERVEVSGAKKRKLGRRYGGNVFWPCGR